ncbi:MAG TPA: aminotransferase class V-fold PLP-dependent enzyme, partial [Gemmataceae bacterium]|nr:aminotransferase class V-fold PLP-dependent enzyme [Gemmataceae bacterium]
LLAGRSAELMRLASRLLCHPCRNVLTTDLGWPSYHDILLSECRRANRRMTTVHLLNAILRGGVTEDEIVARVRNEFVLRGCDGLFLTSVSNLGLRLPVERLVRAVESAAQVWFVVIDGAQDFCHVSSDLRNEYCDLYLAGAHKWLRGYHPMGLGFYGRRRSRAMIETVLSELLREGELGDPLLRFSTQLEADALDGVSETVSLANLFSCHGAVEDATAAAGGPTSFLASRLQNLDVAAGVAGAVGWRPLLPSESLRTGILLLEAERAATRGRPADELREAFYGEGVALTAYGGGLIRLSMPEAPWGPGETEHLAAALQAES